MQSVKDYIVDSHIDILGITETWLSKGEKDKAVIKDLVPTGYSFHHVPRSKGRRGGVGSIYKSSLEFKREKNHKFASFESMELLIK